MHQTLNAHTQTRAAPKGRLIARIGFGYLLLSLFPLAWLLYDTGGWITNEATVFRTTVDGTVLSAWGLTYRGSPGSLLLWTQLLIVCGALAAGTIRRRLVRRTAHVVLIAWTLLPAGNAAWLAAYDHTFIFATTAVFTFLGTACTVIRAKRCWTWSRYGR